MNRAERRRRGLTRSRLARTGSLASAGVLMSVGLFGAYTGSPRLQRAYATGCYLATNEAQLTTALTNSSETCIEIQGTITLSQDLPRISHSEWNGSPRESLGLTIFGSGDDTIDGANDFSGIRLALDDPNQQIVSDAELTISSLSLTNFDTPNNPQFNSIGDATYAYLYQQPHDLRVTLQGVHLSGNASLLQGGALYTGTNSDGYFTTSVYTTIVDSTFSNNTGGVHGGAVMVSTEDDTAVLNVSGSTFDSNNVAGGQFSTYAYGGALSVRARNQASGVAKAIVGPDSRFYQNSSTGSSWSYGGAIYVSNFLEISGSVDDTVIFHDNAADAGGAIHIAKNGGGTAQNATFYANTAAKGNGGAISNYGTSPLSFSAVSISDNSALGNGGGISSLGPIDIQEGSTFERNIATGGTANGGAIFTPSTVTVTGSAVNPVVFADDSATKYGGAVYAYNGGSINSATFEGNTAEWGGAAFSQDIGWTFADSTIRNNDALHTGGGVYAWHGSTAFYRSAIVGNHANYTGGGVATAGSLTLENSFIGSNSLTGGNAGNGAGIHALGDVHLRFTTVYDNYSSGGASEISADNITSGMSVVGNSGTGNIWEFAGTLDDSYSVSTADDTQFGGIGSGDVAPGSLGFGSLDGTAPGQLGSTPDPTSVLALPTTSSGFAPAANPLPLVTRDQLGNLRLAPFTIGARSAVVAAAPSVTSVTPASGSTGGGDLVTIHGSGFTAATAATIGGVAIGNFAVVDDTTITGSTPPGSAGPADVSVAGPGGTGTLQGAFTFVSPNPPAPTPAERASAPRDVRADARVESATAAWLPPTSTGSFPVTSYQAVASPGGQTCMVAAPALTCTITGLTPGKPYTVTARALTGAGWSEASSPSSAVVPLGPEVPTILITNSRDRAQKSMARIEGTTTGLVGAKVVPYLRIAGQADFSPGASTRTVDADGTFVWQRKAKKRFTVYFVSGDVTSNRLVIRPE